MADRTSASRVEPTPKDEKFFEWLERLFFGDGEYPSQIEVWRAKGQNIRGERVTSKPFSPEEKKKKKGESPAEESSEVSDAPIPSAATPKGKPTREWLVAYSNEILFRCQQDCDAECKELKYNVLAMHFGRMDDYYDRWTFRLFSKVRKQKEDLDAEDDDGDGSPRIALLKQSLEHNERIANLYGGAIESVVESFEKQIKSLSAENEALRAKLAVQYEMIEKLQSNQSVREREARWDDMKARHTNTIIERGFALLPALIPGMNANAPSGNNPPQESQESLVLKEFFRDTSNGGKLTQHQTDVAFGVYGVNKELITPGILNREQVQILVDVANLSVHASALDRLLPGGDQLVTMEQAVRLEKEFAEDQLLPVKVILNTRLQRKQQPPPTNGQGAQHEPA